MYVDISYIEYMFCNSTIIHLGIYFILYFWKNGIRNSLFWHKIVWNAFTFLRNKGTVFKLFICLFEGQRHRKKERQRESHLLSIVSFPKITFVGLTKPKPGARNWGPNTGQYLLCKMQFLYLGMEGLFLPLPFILSHPGMAVRHSHNALSAGFILGDSPCCGQKPTYLELASNQKPELIQPLWLH